MDNATFKFFQVKIDPAVLKDFLAAKMVKVTDRSDPETGKNTIIFSLPIGPHRARTMFRVFPEDGVVRTSGGITKMLFGHNLWVGTDEGFQLNQALVIIRREIEALDGVDAGCARAELVFAEVTRHHCGFTPEEKKQALFDLGLMLMTLEPKRYSNPTATNKDPGTPSIGRTKSGKVLRIYLPDVKFGHVPPHVDADRWFDLCEWAADHLRVENVFQERELVAAGLHEVDAWINPTKVETLLKKRYERYGLSVKFRDEFENFSATDLEATNPMLVEYARHFFTGGERGQEITNPRSGSVARFKRLMRKKGYDVDVSFADHKYLVHPWHALLQPAYAVSQVAVVPRLADLFKVWWR